MSTESFHSSQLYLPPPGYHFTSLTLNYSTFGPKKSRVFFLIFLLSELVYTQKNLNKNAKNFRVLGTVDNNMHLKFNTTYLREDVSIHRTNFEVLWQVAQNSFSLLLSCFVAQYVLKIVV